ncbi:type VI secretion system Vgr family protein [Caballeronia glebae]|nr:type VI secretion system Vgr family protein [Caballeronia glebae]
MSAHQHYSLDMPQEPSSVFADIFSVEGTRAIGEPTHVKLRFTHPSHALTRLDYVGKMAKFLIQPPHEPSRGIKPEQPRGIHGIITGFTHLSSNRDESFYELVLESRLALLRNAPKVRWFWDKSFVDVIVQILKEHGFDQLRADFKVRLYRQYVKRAVIAQWEEDDLTFIQRLCRRAGIWFVCGESDTVADCEMIYVHDDFTHYRHDDNLNVPVLPEGGMNSDGAESIFSLETHTKVIPQSYTVRGYNYRKAPDAIEATSVIHDDKTTYGESYTYGVPVLTKEDAQVEALLRQEAAISQQVEYHGSTNMLDAMPGNVVKPSNRTLPDTKYGMLIFFAKFSAARKQPFRVEYKAIPSDRLYRMPLLEETWPRMQGDITAVIASPNQYSQPFITKDGEYVARILADRDPRIKGMESCLLRLAKPFAGSHRTGFHYGLHDGTEVGVAGHLGNPELLYIAHIFHNSLNDDPIVAEDRWMSRTILQTHRNKFRTDDWPDEEHIKLASERGKSQLNLGHIVDAARKKRGDGFELKTNFKGALRAAQGLLISTEPQATQAQVTDTSGATALFERTQAQAGALAQGASASNAEIADLKAENQWLKDELADIKKQVIALSAPQGIGLATPDRVMIGAGKDVSVATSQGFNVSAFRNVAIAAREKLSLFANTLGAKLIAGKGPVEIQAQSDVLALAAQKDVVVTSADGAVRVRANKELVLECGGAYIELKDGTITLGSAKPLQLKLPGMTKQAPEIMHLAGPSFAPAVAPWSTRCDAWIGGSNTIEKLAPPESKFASWEQYANAGVAVPAAPTGLEPPAKTAQSKKAEKAKTTQPKKAEKASLPKTEDVDKNPSDEPTLPLAASPSEPIALSEAAICEWSMPSFSDEFIWARETPQYYKYGNTETSKTTSLCSGIATTKFPIEYDDKNKTLTATVTVVLIPVLLANLDPITNEPIVRADGSYETTPYETYANGANSLQPFSNFGLKQIARVGSHINTSKYKADVERTLNQGNYKLVLDGCSKGSACGRRVSIVFRVDFLIANEAEADAMTDVRKVHIYPQAARADAANWGEDNIEIDNGGNAVPVAMALNVAAHECGHLLNFPDEYWQGGGFVHSTYVKNDKSLNFQLGNSNIGKHKWQMYSPRNLMGGGAVLPKAVIPAHYMEYMRFWFTARTNMAWRVGTK